MNIDFKLIDKSEFECLQIGGEGQVYFGQIVYIHEETGESKKEIPASPKSAMDEEKKGKETPSKTKDKEPVEPVVDEEERAKWKKHRNGLGIQLNGIKTEAGVTCKYAGEWVKDEKTGDGHSIFADGSEYRGYCKMGIFNGDGIYTWPANKDGKCHQYVGKWVDGKMQGKGQFTHCAGVVHKGIFVNN